ncbi:MAG: hypothetical protein EPN61_15350 [Burkholderiaceae bacterium]|nr:MAG: hypothetical protein EPN61_15350 [Burkholderiaceae bacterium]
MEMKAWKITPIDGGYTVDCVNGSTGKVCAQVGVVLVKGGSRCGVYAHDEAVALCAAKNQQVRDLMIARQIEYAEQLAILERLKVEPATATDDNDTYQYN